MSSSSDTFAESPEDWAYERLARNYREQGDDVRWLATLDQYLAAGEDHGLDHAKVRVEIADYYMAKGRWAKAQPYAEAAAQTWAAWAMQCAMRCYEGMKDWDRAELWARRLSERYPQSSVRAWLKFCKRTGHGDIAGGAGPRRAVRRGRRRTRGRRRRWRPQPADALQAGYSSWLQGSTKEAMESMRKAYESTSPLLAGCALMVLADELGDAAQRDAILNDLCAKHRAKAPRMFDVLEMFRDPFARGDRELPDLKALARAVERCETERTRKHRVLRRVVAQEARQAPGCGGLPEALHRNREHECLVEAHRWRRSATQERRFRPGHGGSTAAEVILSQGRRKAGRVRD